MQEEFPFLPRFALIPYDVQIDENLPDNIKLYFGQLVGMARLEGRVDHTEQELACLKKISLSMLKRWNRELERLGYIDIVIEKSITKIYVRI